MVVFVILHYKNVHDTLECLKSIENLYLQNYHVIIVDNGSFDSSTKVLEEINGINKVDVLYNDKNYGFAKGNNIGINYAKNKYNPDYFVVINNDIIIKQKNIIECISETDKKYNFDVLGPKIIARNNINQNPNFLVLYKNYDILKHLIKLSVLDILIKIRLYNYFKNKLRRESTNKLEVVEENQILTSVPLHGSALIFSQKYINKYKEPFDESTFLYGEEEFLNFRRLKDNLKFVYNPTIEVFHKEDASLEQLFNNCDIEKTKFVINHSKHSLTQLLIKKLKS